MLQDELDKKQFLLRATSILCTFGFLIRGLLLSLGWPRTCYVAQAVGPPALLGSKHITPNPGQQLLLQMTGDPPAPEDDEPNLEGRPVTWSAGVRKRLVGVGTVWAAGVEHFPAGTGPGVTS